MPEVFRVIDKLGWVPKRDKASDSKGDNHGSGFHTYNSLAEARDVFENHPERIRSFSQNDDKLTTIESPGKDVEYDVTGDFLDIDRYLEGIPEVFGNAVMGNPRTIFCTINVLDTFVYYTHNKYIMEKQKRILRLVDWMESQGIRCQIVVSADSDCLYHSVVVKEFGDPFDLNHLAVATHPDWLRRIIFLMIEQSKTFSYGYGTAANYDNRMAKYKPQPEDGIYVYVGGYSPLASHKGDNGEYNLNKEFDKIEASIQNIIDEGRTFNEESLSIGGNGYDY